MFIYPIVPKNVANSNKVENGLTFPLIVTPIPWYEFLLWDVPKQYQSQSTWKYCLLWQMLTKLNRFLYCAVQCAPIRKNIMNYFQARYVSFRGGNELLSKAMNHCVVVVQAVRNAAEAFVDDFVAFSEVCYKRMYCCLACIPVPSLHGIYYILLLISRIQFPRKFFYHHCFTFTNVLLYIAKRATLGFWHHVVTPCGILWDLQCTGSTWPPIHRSDQCDPAG